MPTLFLKISSLGVALGRILKARPASVTLYRLSPNHASSYQYLAPSYSNTSYSATSLTDESIQYPGAQDWNSTKGSLDASKYTHQHSPSSAVENATLNETDTSELATFSQDLETNLGSHQPQVTTNYGYNNAEALDSGEP